MSVYAGMYIDEHTHIYIHEVCSFQSIPRVDEMTRDDTRRHETDDGITRPSLDARQIA